VISHDQAVAVKSLGEELGFDRVTFTNVDPAEDDRRFFEDWCRDGLGAGMAWLIREPGRRAEPKTLLAEALGLISLGVSYFQGDLPPAPPVPAGRVARYAWGLDYHSVIERRLQSFRSGLERILGPDLKVRPALDVQPLLERAFARRAGLGFVGKNTNLIAPRTGSWIFLTEFVVNRSLPEDEPVVPGCGGCVNCLSSCPTDALAVPYRLDSRECIAYHTIENRGWIPREFRAKMGSWLFGCDDCQDVCPFNARSKETRWPEFRAENGVGAWVPLSEVLRLRTNEMFKKRFGGTPLLRPKRAGLVRNACVLAATTGSTDRLLPELEDCLFHDPEPVVRGHAAWALGQNGPVGRRLLERASLSDSDPSVRGEISAALEMGAV
jgi:epoxyqueuosine reductase